MSSSILKDIRRGRIGEGQYDTTQDIGTSKSFDEAAKNDASGSSEGIYSYGDNGLFHIPETNNAIVSALIMPRRGVIDAIPVLRDDPYDDTEAASSMFGTRNYDFDTIMTGVTEGDIESFSNQPTADCDPGPTGGMTKLCTVVNTIARLRGRTREVSLFRAGLARDRLDERTFRLLNSAEGLQAIFGTPGAMPAQDMIVANEMSRRLFELLTSFRRFFSRRVWDFNPANNNGEARQFMGLELHVNEGNKVDYRSGAKCDAADSLILDFGYDDLVTGSRDIVEYLETADHVNTVNASRQGLTPIDGMLVMHEALFHELTGVMPVKQYQEVLAAMSNQPNADRSRIMVNATDAQADRNRFRTEQILPLNGRMYGVILDDGIPLENSTTNGNLAAGEFASDIYFLPMTVAGGLPATFFQFYDHNNRQSEGALAQVTPSTFTFTSDGGIFRWHVNYLNGCIYLHFDFSPWLKMKFPQTAWRVTNIRFRPTRRARSSYPDSDYFANGGITDQDTSDNYYTPWSPDSPTQV